jgi:tRNA (cytidine32/uridine32-2'-O)-methyltransferase
MSALDPAAVDVVLVRPARAANVALACRAMKAMGLERLVLVDAPLELGRGGERALAYGAWDLLDAARSARSLAEAVEGSVLVAGTSGRPPRGEAWTPRRLAEEGGKRASGGGRASVVFGPEATGLGREELATCHLTVHIPTRPEQPSLNLAQAVLVVAYELRIAALMAASRPAPGGAEPAASAGELEQALAEFRSAAVGIGFLNPQSPDRLLAEWRRLLARAVPTSREITLLRGLARQMAFAASVIARAPREAG